MEAQLKSGHASAMATMRVGLLCVLAAASAIFSACACRRVVRIYPTETGLVLLPPAPATDAHAACAQYGLAQADVDDANVAEAAELVAAHAAPALAAHVGSLYGRATARDGRPLALYAMPGPPGGAVAPVPSLDASLPVLCYVAARPAAAPDDWAVPASVEPQRVFAIDRFVLVDVPTSPARAARFCAHYGMRLARPGAPGDASVLAALADSGRTAAWVAESVPPAHGPTSIDAAKGTPGSAAVFHAQGTTERASVLCEIPEDGTLLADPDKVDNAPRLPSLTPRLVERCSARGTSLIVLPRVLARPSAAARLCAAYGLALPAAPVGPDAYYAVADAVRACGRGSAWAPLSAGPSAGAALVLAHPGAQPAIALLTPWEPRATQEHAFICERDA